MNIKMICYIQENGFLNWLESEQWRLESQKALIFDSQLYELLSRELDKYCDNKGYILDQLYWKRLRQVLPVFSAFQKKQLNVQTDIKDSFANYAALYDEINGQNNLKYITNILNFFIEKYDPKFSSRTVLSAGCGTGIVEEYIINKLGVAKQNLFGFDVSEAMVKLAQRKIQADILDVVHFKPEEERWDFVCAWTNVLQYLPCQDIDIAVINLAKTLKHGGYFLSDFITSDHIRCFPNVLKSKSVSLLRQPSLLYENQNMFQITELFNVSNLNDNFIVTYEGKHKRYLPSIYKIRQLFNNYFSQINFYDALSLEPLRDNADTSESTRYILIAKK